MTSRPVPIKFLCVLLILLYATTPAWTQGNRYPFIKYELNRIVIPDDSLLFISVINKMQTQLRKPVHHINLVQIGGSHVQADAWTGKIRENINGYFSQQESCRGLIFPYRAVKTNGAIQFDVQFNKLWEGFRNVKLLQPGNMGLMGWTATARDSGQNMEITLKSDTASVFHFDGLRIFHDAGTTSFMLTVTVNDSTYKPVYNHSCGCSEIIVPDCSNRFLITVHRTDTLQHEFVLHGIQTMLSRPTITYHSVGVNGASVGSFLNCNLLEQQLAMLNPDIVIFSIGINDSFDKNFTRQAFEASYSELIRRIRTTCPDVVFLFITNTDSYRKARKKYYKNPKGKEVQKAMYNLASEHCGVVWDLFSVMGGYGSMSNWKRHHLAHRDMIHLNRKGYHLIGDLFFEALKKFTEAPQTPQ